MITLQTKQTRWAAVFGALSLAACSGTAPTGFFSPDGGEQNPPGSGGSGTGSGTGSSSVVSLNTSGGGGPGNEMDTSDCAATAKVVYVTGEGSQLWSFVPPSTFKLVGTLSCLGSDFTPTHMTVDRTGTAWVAAWVTDPNSPLYDTSSLFTASTVDASCTKFSKWVPQPGGNFQDFALTFIGTTSATDTTLYLLGTTGGVDNFMGGGQAVLGSFDTLTGQLTTVGMPNVASAGGDMTTNGDGTLYYLQDTAELDLYEINPSSAAVIKSLTPSATGGGDQALAFYGGSFYAFEQNVVYQFDPTTQTTTTLGEAPLQVTGAGQSTCVPMTPPTSK
jgi:hypothetical protein